MLVLISLVALEARNGRPTVIESPLPQSLNGNGCPRFGPEPEAVDMRRPMMVRYSVSTESLDDRSRLSPDCTEPGGGERVLPSRIAGLSCSRQEICLAGLASRGYGNLMLTLEDAAL